MPRFLTRKDVVDVFRTLLVPDEIRKYVWDIDLERLLQAGYTTFLLDVDRTLLGHSERVMSLQHVNWIQKCKTYGFDVYFLSNNRSKKRIQKVADQVDCNGIYCAMKPLVMGAKQLEETYKLDLKKCIVVGDQVFKDTVLGNWLEIYNVLVEPLDNPLPLFSRLQYEFERYLVKRLTAGASNAKDSEKG